jgi:exonuclease III
MVDKNNPRQMKVIRAQPYKNPKNKTVSSTPNPVYGKKNDDKSHSLIIYHQNIQGLNGKINEFMLSLTPDTPHIICMSEHHLKCHEIDFAYIPSYKLGAAYCRTIFKCGGVCIYIHKNISFSNINLTKHCKEKDLEIAAVKLSLHLKNVIVLCAYRAPSGDLEFFLNQLDNILNTLHTPKTEFILCGDLNIDYAGNSNKKAQLENLLTTYNLTGTVLFSTRISNTSSTTIDNIFIDNRNSYSIQPHINGLSDHDAQILKLNGIMQPINIPKTNTIRKINNQTITEFHSLLSWELWEDVFETNNVNTMFNNFLNTYLRCYYSSFKKINVSSSNQSHNEWITKGIKISCKRKKELFELCKICNNQRLTLYYKKYCTILTKVIRTAKKLHYNKIILRSNNKMKSTWRIINGERGTSQSDPSATRLVQNNNTITNKHKIANLFNNYFISVTDYIKAENSNDVNPNKINPVKYLLEYYEKPFSKMEWQYASTKEIYKIIKSLKSKKTYGYDEISNHIIKLSSPYIISPLTHICNAALSSGVFPDRLKYAIIKPIHKKGSKQDISNYRPISLLTSFSKIFEKLMYNRLYLHLEKNNILVQEQFGFRTQHSTEQATFSLINCILTAMNNNQRVGGIFCDLQKAFDCVDYKILVDKLKFYGIDGKFKTLIESYLTNRYQKVTLGKTNCNNTSSEWVRIKCGVPQGSILGPLFFLIYINDLPTLMRKENNIVLYADDTSIVITDSNSEDFYLNVNMLFKDLNNWFKSNSLSLNFSKTHFLEFRPTIQDKPNMLIHHNNNYITNAFQTKFLGLTIEVTLSWKEHIDQLIKRMSSASYALRQIKHYLPIETLKIIYFAHIHTIMSYGIIFWGNSPHAKKVFILQKKIIRIITNTSPRESCREIFKNMQIMTLYSQYIYTHTHTHTHTHTQLLLK